MILCLDIGNTRVKGAVFGGQELLARFDGPSDTVETPATFSDFLTEKLAEHSVATSTIEAISICQVRGDIEAALEESCRKLFGQTPFLLNGTSQQSLTLHYPEPRQLGPDRIAAAIGAVTRWPGENLIVIDCGTAVTFCCVDHQRHHLGGAIAAGPALMVQALHRGTGRLPSVEIKAQPPVLGCSTEGGIQSGAFYGSLGLIREVADRLRSECFGRQPVRVVATGGHAAIFEPFGLFDAIDPDLVPFGLLQAHPLNSSIPALAGHS